MPAKITKIVEQKKRKNRQSVYIDDVFAFGCNINVIAKFHLKVGDELTPEKLEKIRDGEVRQECFDRAVRYLEQRMHSRSELKTKLSKLEYGPPTIEAVLDRLTEMKYLDDKRFAESRAESAAVFKHHGPNRARMELAKRGVERETARRAVEEVYEAHDTAASAKLLAERKWKSLQRLEPHVAKRRLVGMLLRRGYDWGTIKPVIEEVLGNAEDLPSEE